MIFDFFSINGVLRFWSLQILKNLNLEYSIFWFSKGKNENLGCSRFTRDFNFQKAKMKIWSAQDFHFCLWKMNILNKENWIFRMLPQFCEHVIFFFNGSFKILVTQDFKFQKAKKKLWRALVFQFNLCKIKITESCRRSWCS